MFDDLDSNYDKSIKLCPGVQYLISQGKLLLAQQIISDPLCELSPSLAAITSFLIEEGHVNMAMKFLDYFVPRKDNLVFRITIPVGDNQELETVIDIPLHILPDDPDQLRIALQEIALEIIQSISEDV